MYTPSKSFSARQPASIALLLTGVVVGSALQCAVFPLVAHADVVATVKAKTQRMSDASLTSTQDGWYNVGDHVTLVCSRRGQSVQGYFSFNIPNGGWDNLWYKTSDGHFVADVDIETGTLQVVVSDCDAGTPAAQPAAPSQSKADAAVAKANSMVGSDAYDFKCGVFVANAYGRGALGYGSALQFRTALANAGQIHMDGTPPAGALVFSQSRWDVVDGQHMGHVVIARSDGKFVSGGVSRSYGTGHTVQVLDSPNPSPGSEYLGWAYAPADW